MIILISGVNAKVTSHALLLACTNFLIIPFKPPEKNQKKKVKSRQMEIMKRWGLKKGVGLSWVGLGCVVLNWVDQE